MKEADASRLLFMLRTAMKHMGRYPLSAIRSKLLRQESSKRQAESAIRFSLFSRHYLDLT